MSAVASVGTGTEESWRVAEALVPRQSVPW